MPIFEKVDRAPLFYFDFGVSYTKFEYTNLIVPKNFEAREDRIMKISVYLANVGTFDGSEVVQVYVADVKSSIQRPLEELKAFKKVELAVGQSAKVELELDKLAISFWSEVNSSWLAEAGYFMVIISRGANPKDHLLEKNVYLSQSFTWEGV